MRFSTLCQQSSSLHVILYKEFCQLAKKNKRGYSTAHFLVSISVHMCMHNGLVFRPHSLGYACSLLRLFFLHRDNAEMHANQVTKVAWFTYRKYMLYKKISGTIDILKCDRRRSNTTEKTVRWFTWSEVSFFPALTSYTRWNRLNHVRYLSSSDFAKWQNTSYLMFSTEW